METSTDLGLLVLRLVIGGLILAHGSQKAFGAFGGMGPEGTAPLFETWGFRPGRSRVLLAAATEITGATLLVLGLLTPLGAAMILGTLLVAASVNADKGLWAVKGGYELPLLYALVAGALAFTGPGRISLDHAFGLTRSWTPVTGVVAVVVGALAAYAFIASSRRARALTPQETA
ncbi:putative oxidoreductase [Knoellia remsis]|uniref:Putative oxidoreductase n=1 Tax=Knoellia remsis TaxID=407159 RepID=A0A2T0UMX0_9MICO|nr:DoxX family protein [Knoellia remsis]PRY59279.1 putative oxidoreductase [Knoellia remsis]